MRGSARHLVLLLAALAFVGGVPLALTIPPVFASEPCPHQHQQMAGEAEHHPAPQPHPQGQGAAGCLSCCIGSCLAVPGLATNPMISVPLAASPVRYWDAGTRLAARSIRPDPAPPRPSA